MAERGDITVNFDLDPRLVSVAAPSVEVTIQDLHDTLRAIEDDLTSTLFEDLISSAGKESLGGGVEVGITSTLQNAQLSFAARTTSVSNGTSTSTGSATILTDTSATFEDDGVVPGASLFNYPDESVATVLQVLNQTQLLHEPLLDGVTDLWTATDRYKVWNEIQVNVDGGNLVAVDRVGDDLDPIFPTFATQVVRTASSSSTRVNQLALEHATFNGGVEVDPNNDTGRAVSGTDFPTGTLIQPSDNFTDALAIMNERSFATLFVIGQGLTLSSGDFGGVTLVGSSASSTSLTVAAWATVLNAEFFDLDIQGVFDGSVTIARCVVRTCSMVEGAVQNSRLRGTITLSSGQFSLIGCVDDLSGFGTPTIDFGGAGSDVIIRDYRGGLLLTNKSGPEDVSVDGTLRLVLDATYGGAGDLLVRGNGPRVDNQGSFANLTDQLVSGEEVTETHRFRGLDPDNPLVAVDPVAGVGTHSAGGKVVTITESPLGTHTTSTP